MYECMYLCKYEQQSIKCILDSGVSVCICMYVCMYLCMCMYVHMYVCMYVCM